MHTTDIQFKEGVLTLSLNSAALRQELHMRRKNLLTHINEYFGSEVVKEIRVK
jgi:predicted nucleic acid-binding Zn ribbon protein